MGRAKWKLAVVLSCVLAAGGCSDSDDDDTDPIDVLESQISVLLQSIAFLIQQVDPFPAPAPAPAPAPTPGPAFAPSGLACTDIDPDDELCTTGSVEQCPPGGDDSVEIRFTACAGSAPGVDATVSGSLFYPPPPPEPNWPSGERVVTISGTQVGNLELTLVFDGTENVVIDVTDLSSNVSATCTGSLVSYVADCVLATE